MSSAIEGLEPGLVWKHFAAISRIPRGSKNEAAAAQFVLDSAREMGLDGERDDFGNVVVRKPASFGRERAPGVCLQSHLDMVCEKNADKAHDFAKDPIELVRQGDILKADGTTLGADNGIGVATSLAVMEDRSLDHGPLELLFTVDEETGLTGAHHLKSDFVKSRILLNLDSEEEGEIYVGCAGGLDTMGTWNVVLEDARPNMIALDLRVTGLRGGHSGLEIDKGRGNALKIVNRVIMALADAVSARLARIDGGNKRNAIPREAFALIFVPRSRVNRAKKITAGWNTTIRDEFKAVEPDLNVTLTEAQDAAARVLKRKLQKQIMHTICALPHGVIKMSAEIAGLVETSTNVAVIKTSGDRIALDTSQRSSVASEIQEIARTAKVVFELGGAQVAQGDGYPGWKPDMGSPILKRAIAAYESLYGKAPEVKAVHAGLECGIIGEKYRGMDMISIGPTLQDVHSPEEKIHIESVPKFWKFLTTLLKSVV
ncbi:MAG: aminoacyl-histidine dipeptidase [Vicinamibacteria bacterium]|nr:aminoacyl-histidine dipeptidase [Vicinamibacteria bacterium]